MFDVSFFELAVIGVLALVVLGPERLPGAARTLGGLLRRARASWASLKSEIEREIDADSLRKPFGDARREVEEPFDLLGKSLREVSTRLDPSALSRKSGLLSDAPATAGAMAAMASAREHDAGVEPQPGCESTTMAGDGVMLPLAASVPDRASGEPGKDGSSLLADRSDAASADGAFDPDACPQHATRTDGDDERR